MSDSAGTQSDETREAFEEMRDVLDDLEQSFWVPLLHSPFESLEQVIEGLARDGTPLEQPFRAFVSNLAAAKDLLEFPYLLLTPFVLKGSDAEKQLSELRAGGDVTEYVVDKNFPLAHKLVSAVLRGSRSHLKSRPAVLNRLMHQACLLAWIAFETFCKEVFISALNQRPDLYAVLTRNQQLKERFAVSAGSWPSLLEKSDYDLRGKLGTILGADRDFSSPQLLKELFPTLFADLGGSEQFLKVFESSELWRLGNRRHLIAHRCGIVDAEYMRRCDDPTQEVGKVLSMRGRDAAQSLAIVASAAICLYGKARRCWIDPPSSEEEQRAHQPAT